MAPERCSNRRSYSNTLYAGYEEQRPISVGANGTFKKTVVYRFTDEGVRYKETQTVSGKIEGYTAAGSVTARVQAAKPGRAVARCTSQAQHWRLVD